MKMLKYLLLVMLTAGTFSWAGVSTTDISGILPKGGEMYYEAGDNSTNSWVFNWDTTSYHTSTAFFETDGTDKYAVLRCFGNVTNTFTGAYIQAGPNLSVHMDMSTVRREELLVTVTFRGSTCASYGGGTIFGQLQPQVNSAYLGTFTDYRRPGVSRGYLEAVSMKGISISTTTSGKFLFGYGTYMVNTAWTTYTWRIVPTQSNYFILGYIGVVYRADAYDKYLPFTTDVHIKQIKLQVINYY
jgi:hypothetical protein